VLSLVKTQVDNWISSGTLQSYINTAKSRLTNAYYPYIEDMWVASNVTETILYKTETGAAKTNTRLSFFRLFVVARLYSAQFLGV